MQLLLLLLLLLQMMMTMMMTDDDDDDNDNKQTSSSLFTRVNRKIILNWRYLTMVSISHPLNLCLAAWIFHATRLIR
jgi:hypothetical protein